MKKKRIGIVGGGQLGRMIAIDAIKLGYNITVIDPTPNCPAAQVGAEQIIADYNDEKAIRKLAKISDYLTFEIELANATLLDELSEKGLQINPSAKTLAIIKDKLAQKQFLKKHRIAVADFIEVQTADDVKRIAKKFGYPLVLKARFDAYDGRGNALIKNEQQIAKGFKKLRGRKLYVEKFVPFIKELSVITARNINGEIISYPVVETHHKNNILHMLYSPAPISESEKKKAQRLAEKTMQHLNGAGVFGIEMFLTEDGNVLINEIAPRVHNSGHHTIEAFETSQFEQHARAVTGMPFGSTKMKMPAAVMTNILGERDGATKPTGVKEAEKIPGVTVHLYGKLQTRKERKMGHLTAIAKTLAEAKRNAKKARKMITI